jgi:CRP/FNR family transcriptional regulator, cyclic AMP receptor protein
MSMSRDRDLDFSIITKLGGVAKTYKAGSEIMREGEPRSHMYYLHKGKAAVLAKGHEVEEVRDGGIFGEMAIIDHGPRSASVVARTDCEVVVVDERLFLLLVRQAPFFAIDVMRSLVRRLRAMNEMLSRQ